MGGFVDHYRRHSLTRGLRQRSAAPPLGNFVEGPENLGHLMFYILSLAAFFMISSAGPQVHPFLFASFHSFILGYITLMVQPCKAQQKSLYFKWSRMGQTAFFQKRRICGRADFEGLNLQCLCPPHLLKRKKNNKTKPKTCPCLCFCIHKMQHFNSRQIDTDHCRGVQQNAYHPFHM